MNTNDFLVREGDVVDLKKYPTILPDNGVTKKEAKKDLQKNLERMAELQDLLYAHNKYGLLIIFQAMDAAGKDSAIKHVMKGVNPQGTQVFSFKQPSQNELDHDYLWRTSKSLPERGRIGIFNRSYYEEVLVVKVHNLIEYQRLPEEFMEGDIWEQRYRQIREFERYIYENGIIPIKFFLHLSKEEQRQRFIKRLETPSKNWKFSSSDLKERAHWDEYQKCYEEAIMKTSTSDAPWYVIPADEKPFTRYLISEIIINTLEGFDMSYPSLSEEQLTNLELYKKQLSEEK